MRTRYEPRGSVVAGKFVHNQDEPEHRPAVVIALKLYVQPSPRDFYVSCFGLPIGTSANPSCLSLTFSTTNVTSSSWGRPFDHSSPTLTKCSIISCGGWRAATAKARFVAA